MKLIGASGGIGILMITPYEGYKIYGPYKRKDNRQHVIAYKSKEFRYTISYPKYLMEIHLGRYLMINEDVHHIDGDVTNNALENFEIVNKRQHISKHNQKYDFITLYCIGCGKLFYSILSSIDNWKIIDAIMEQ